MKVSITEVDNGFVLIQEDGAESRTTVYQSGGEAMMATARAIMSRTKDVDAWTEMKELLERMKATPEEEE